RRASASPVGAARRAARGVSDCPPGRKSDEHVASGSRARLSQLALVPVRAEGSTAEARSGRKRCTRMRAATLPGSVNDNSQGKEDTKKVEIKKVEIQPVLGAALPEVAHFLHNWHAHRDQASPIEPPARTLGFYLFKRYLNSPGYAFFFSTTCNANSGALWAKLGACTVPNSDVEYVLPLKLDVMLPFFLAGRTSSSLAAELARLVGRCANPVLQLLARQSAELTVEPCRDWETL